MSSTAVSLPPGGIYDVTVFGATGFVGQLCIRHLLDHPDFTSGAFTWAIAGRSASKLYSLKQKYALPSSVGIIEADTSKPLEGGLEKMVKQSRVVMNLVGPYSDYGSFHLAELCAQHGVSYTDLSGESLYNKNLVEKLHETAKKNGATLLPSVGYDSLPADLSVYLGARRVLENAEKKGAQVGHIEATAGGSVMGSVSQNKLAPALGLAFTLTFVAPFFSFPQASGGTLASWRSMVSGPDPWQMLWQKPTAIVDSLYQSSSAPKPSSDLILRYAQWLPQCKGYGALNPLGIHNARAVYHTAALLDVEPDSDDRKTKYSPTFQFVDLLVHAASVPSPISWLVAIIASSAVRIVALLMANSALVRSLSAKLVPVGTGPSEKAQRAGFVNMKTLVVGWKSVNDVKGGQQRTPIAASVARWKATNADPGYLMTSRVISEVSLLVAFDRKNGDKKIHSGVRTAATMDKNPAALVERLQKYAKIEIGVEDWDFERKGVFNSLAGSSASASKSSVPVASAKPKVAVPLSLPADPTNSSPYPHCPAGYIPLSEADGDIIRITYEPLDIGKMTEEVSSRWAGAVVAFLGMTRDDRSVGKGEEEGRTLSVSRLEYEAYTPLALATMRSIVSRAKSCPPDEWPPQPASRADKDAIKASLKDVVLSPDFPSSSSSTSSDPSSPEDTDESLIRPTNPLSIVRIALVHRIGPVGLKESSILIAVSSPHRRRAFEVAEWILEETKKEVPVWKREVRIRADEGEEEGTAGGEKDMAAGGGREIPEDGEGWVGLREAERRGEVKTEGYQV